MAKVNVIFVKAHPKYAYFTGETGEIDSAEASRLMKEGYVMPLADTSPVTGGDKNPLPEDLPVRDLLWAEGFDAVEKIVEAGESLQEIKGIGKKTYVDIMDYCLSPDPAESDDE